MHSTNNDGLPNDDQLPIAFNAETSGDNAEASGDSAMELTPWIVLLGEGETVTSALWQIQQLATPAIALFSDESQAIHYNELHCHAAGRVLQLERTAVIRLLMEVFRQGVHYAALNPTETGARQLFVIREVLQAARSELSSS